MVKVLSPKQTIYHPQSHPFVWPQVSEFAKSALEVVLYRSENEYSEEKELPSNPAVALTLLVKSMSSLENADAEIKIKPISEENLPNLKLYEQMLTLALACPQDAERILSSFAEVCRPYLASGASNFQAIYREIVVPRESNPNAGFLTGESRNRAKERYETEHTYGLTYFWPREIRMIDKIGKEFRLKYAAMASPNVVPNQKS